MCPLCPVCCCFFPFFHGIAALVSSIERQHKWLIENGWHATKIPGEIVAITWHTFQQTEPAVRPLPPPLDRSQPCNKRINGLRYAGHYALLFIREGVLSLAPPSSGCLELGVNNSGHYWLHNYKMLLLQNVSSFFLARERGHGPDRSRLMYCAGNVACFTVLNTNAVHCKDI